MASTKWGGSFGAWSWIGPSYETESEFMLTGNVLHTSITYSPSVTDLVGASTVYVFNRKSEALDHAGRNNQLYFALFWLHDN